jgi:tight adherence protein B
MTGAEFSSLLAATTAVVVTARFTGRHRARPTRRPSARGDAERGTVFTAPPSAIAWADLLDAVARHVRSGRSLSTAFRQALDTHPVDGTVIHPDASFHDVVHSASTDPDEAAVIHALAVAHSFGGAVAAALQATVSVLRERAAVRADIDVHSAQARLSARVLTAVPIVFSGWGLMFSRSFRSAVATPAGVVAAITGVLLNLGGWCWMRHAIAQVHR